MLRAQRGLAISLALNGASFSGIIVVPFLVLITEAHGFATAMLVGALSIVGLIVPLLALSPGGGRMRAPHPDGERERARYPDSQLRPQKFGVLEFVGPVCAGDLSQAGFLVHQIWAAAS